MTSLSSRGYTVLPEPQRVALEPADIEFDATWRLGVAGDLSTDDGLCAILNDYLGERHGVTLLGTPSAGPRVVLSLAPQRDMVTVVGAADRDLPSLTAQEYEIRIGPNGVFINATARAGLFYGIATFVQLIRPGHGRLWLPQGRINDWPDVARRHLLWDNSEHLDRLEALKAAVRQAALFKVNGFVLKLDGHFVYASAPELAAPHALTPEQLQDLTDYALRFHVQVIPYLDSPGHVAWILKHPKFHGLRELPGCNYELCTTDPDSYRLLTALVDDLIAANKGVEHFVLSTDEAYYVGLGRSRPRARELSSVGKLQAEFVTQVADYLHSQGRTVQIWGEYPIEREDIPSLPSHVINGVTTGPKYDPVYAANGIRQFIYAATQAELPNFPDYFAADPADVPYPVDPTAAITKLYDDISCNPVRRQSNLAGVFIAAWADGGLHPETFWLGFVTGAAWAWHPYTPEPTEAVMRFSWLFYGNDVLDVHSMYELMSTQAQFYEYGWDLVDSTARSPLFGTPTRSTILRAPPRIDRCLCRTYLVSRATPWSKERTPGPRPADAEHISQDGWPLPTTTWSTCSTRTYVGRGSTATTSRSSPPSPRCSPRTSASCRTSTGLTGSCDGRNIMQATEILSAP